MASVRALVQERYDARDRRLANRSRFRDLQLAVWLPGDDVLDDAPAIRVGGCWDMTNGCYVGKADSEVKIPLTRSQLDAAQPMIHWLRQHLAMRELVAGGATWDEATAQVWQDEQNWYRWLWYGGRRGGKTWLACLSVCLFALMIPGVRVVMVSPTQDDTSELRTTILGSMLASEWRDWQEAKQTIELINGSVIELHTAHRNQLKLGKVDMAVANEAQEQKREVVNDLQGNTSDVAGLTILTANPPRKNTLGRYRATGAWVQELYNEVVSGERPFTRKCFFNPEHNTRVSHEALRAAGEGMSEQEYRREILGDMTVPLGTMALASFSAVNMLERIPITWRKRDVTRDVAERWFGISGANRIGGVDFDKGAGCSWVSGRFYLPANSTDVQDAFLVIDGGERLLGQHEDRFGISLAETCDEYGNPIFPDKQATVLVADASSRWQSTERAHDPEDRPSWQRLEAHGWLLCRPDPGLERNPRVADRFELAIDSLRAKWCGQPRVLFTHGARWVIESNEKLALSDGKVDRKSIHAHLVDCWTYIVWRRWGAEHLTARAQESAQRGLPRTVAIPGRALPLDRKATP